MSILNNPEIKRNIWLDISPLKLILVPVIMAMSYYLIYLITGVAFFNISYYLSAIFIALFLIWGGKMASDSLIIEMNEKTWICQRMTMMTPFEIMIGKLIGSTLFAWYGALSGSVMFLFAASKMESLSSAFVFLLTTLLFAITSYSVTFSIILIGASKRSNSSKIRSVGFNFSIFAAMPLFFIFMRTVKEYDKVKWFNLDIYAHHFLLFASFFLLLISLVSTYVKYREEFQYQSSPSLTLISKSFLILLVSGLVANIGDFSVIEFAIIWSFSVDAIIVLMIYFSLYWYKKDVVVLKKIITHFKKREFSLFYKNSPDWLIFLLVLIPLSLLLSLGTFASIFTIPQGLNSSLRLAFELSSLENGFLMFINILIFLLRDISIFFFVSFSSKSKSKADNMSLLYLVLLHIMIPSILKLADLDVIASLFTVSKDVILLSTISGVIQLIVAFFFLSKVWKKVSRVS